MTSGTTPQPPSGGRAITRTELIVPEPAEALAHLLDIPSPAGAGGTLPPLWHWVYLLDRHRQSELGADGHAVRGVPAPPGPGLLRMFAGGRVTTYRPLRFGEPATRTTRLVSSVDKVGRSGPLTFITVRSDIDQGGVTAVVDEQDLVYRAAGSTLPSRAAPGDGGTAPIAAAPGTAGAPGDGGTAPTTAAPGTAGAPGTPPPPGRTLGSVTIQVDPVLLFRFSALTYNAHRIHYDRDYATREGYPDLVIHGPLQALMMSEAIRRAGVDMLGARWSYRLVAPVFGTRRLTATAVADPDGITTRVDDQAGHRSATGELRPAATRA